VAFVRNYVSEGRVVSIIRLESIRELGTALEITSNSDDEGDTFQRNVGSHEPQGDTSQKRVFFMDLFWSSGFEGSPVLLGPSERANVFLPSPVDGNRWNIRNVVLPTRLEFRTMDKVQENSDSQGFEAFEVASDLRC
jgi:hypothetical protein